MFILFKQSENKYYDPDGYLEINYEQAEDFSLWENVEDALEYVKNLIKEDFHHSMNIPINFRVEDGMIKFSNSLQGKVIEECDFEYYIKELQPLG